MCLIVLFADSLYCVGIIARSVMCCNVITVMMYLDVLYPMSCSEVELRVRTYCVVLLFAVMSSVLLGCSVLHH